MRSWAVYVCITSLYLNTSIHTTRSEEIKTLRTEGIFKTFLRNIFDTLIDFPRTEGVDFEGLRPYMFKLARCVGEMGYRETRTLARVIYSLSKKNEHDIKRTLREYRRDLEDKVRWRVKFLKAMNSIFTSEQNLLFHDYIRELKRYGKKDQKNPPIVEQTRVILNYVILNSVMQMSSRSRRDLRSKMKKAIKEYRMRYSRESSQTSSEERSTFEASDYSYETFKKKMHKKLPINDTSRVIISVRKQ